MVYCFQDFGSHGLIYPLEGDNTPNMVFYIEENENGILDNAYLMNTIFCKTKEIFNTILNRIKNDLFEVKYKDYSIMFKAMKSDKSYVGKLKKPSNSLWTLTEIEKKDTITQIDLFIKCGIVLIGYSEGKVK